jgi:hypothetical protein
VEICFVFCDLRIGIAELVRNSGRVGEGSCRCRKGGL